MPQIIIQANPAGGERADVTLSERLVAANLESPHYAAQLIERLAWAAADAEAIESQACASEPREHTLLDPPERPRDLRDRESASRAGPARLATAALVLVIATGLSLASAAVAYTGHRHYGSERNSASQAVAGAPAFAPRSVPERAAPTGARRAP
jgi:hypothetical protein